MRNRKQDDNQTESLFEQKIRFQMRMKKAQDDVLFFGVVVMFALFTTQGMFSM